MDSRVQKAQKHMQRAQELMLESQLHFGAPDRKFFKRNYSQDTIDMIFKHRKGYLVDAIIHLISAAKTVNKIDLKLLFPTYTYCDTFEEAKEKSESDLSESSYYFRSFAPSSCISDVVVGILRDEKEIEPFLNRNIHPWKGKVIHKDEFMSVLTRKMNDAVRSHNMREDLDNTWESEPSRSLFPDTSIELELRELLVIAISISSLAMQHVNTNGAKCGHPDLISKFSEESSDFFY